MATQDFTIERLKRKWDRAVEKSRDRGVVYGRLGQQEEDGTWTVLVPRFPRHVFVTLDGEASASRAINRGVNPEDNGGMPIELRKDRGELVVTGIDHSRIFAFKQGETYLPSEIPKLPDSVVSQIEHGNIAGLGDDDHTQYLLLAGRAGGQHLYGGDAASEDLTLESTSHSTKGGVRIFDRFIYLGKNASSNPVLYFRSNRTGSGHALGAIIFQNNDVDVARLNSERVGSDEGELIFSTKQSSDGSLVERMRILSNGNVKVGNYGSFVYANSNIGLHSNSNGAGGVEMRNPNTGTAADVRLSMFLSSTVNDGSLSLVLPGVNHTGSLFGLPRNSMVFLFSRNRHLVLGAYDAGSDVIFGTNNTERMRITSAGNVGIGIGDPGTNLLRVAGVAQFLVGSGAVNISTPSGEPGLQLINTNRSDIRRYTDRLAILTSGSISQPSSSNGINILNNGNVGIGTTNPATIFHVFNSGGEAILKLISDTDYLSGLLIGSNAASTRAKSGIFFNRNGLSWDRGDLVFAVNSAADGADAGLVDAAMTIKYDKQVGIGTTSPERLLDVNGMARFAPMPGFQQTGDLYFSRSDGINRTHRMRFRNDSSSDGNWMSFLISHDASGGSTEVLRIVGNGRVGVGGVSVPQQALHVNGNILADRIPTMLRRKGGSSTNWSTPGATTYDPGQVRIQTGVMNVSVQSGNNRGFATVTFASSFGNVPVVYVSPLGNLEAAAFNAGASNTTSSYFDITVEHVIGEPVGSNINVSVAWMAIGPM